MENEPEQAGVGKEKEREAIGGYLSAPRHAADGGDDSEPLGAAHHGPDTDPSAESNGPDGAVNSRAQASAEDQDGLAPSAEEGTEAMTAAEASGQVAYGAGDTTGETGSTGAASSSG